MRIFWFFVWHREKYISWGPISFFSWPSLWGPQPQREQTVSSYRDGCLLCLTVLQLMNLKKLNTKICVDLLRCFLLRYHSIHPSEFGWNCGYLSLLSCCSMFNLIPDQVQSESADLAQVIFCLIVLCNPKKDFTTDWAGERDRGLIKNLQVISMEKITGLAAMLHIHFQGWPCNTRILAKEDQQSSSSSVKLNVE